nr:glycosyltransferase family 2 protein [Variovorax boronicumulans]
MTQPFADSAARPLGLTIAIPTFNRGYCLERTLPSYFQAEGVTDILLVVDASEDDTVEIFTRIARSFPLIRSRHVAHARRSGAARARQTALDACETTFMAFGEDDVVVSATYYSALLQCVSSGQAALASGRIVYLADHEEPRSQGDIAPAPEVPVERYFDLQTLTVRAGCAPPDGSRLVFGHALYLARTEQLRAYGFDQTYSCGTGYREESDTQLLMYLDGLTHRYCRTAICQHLPFSFVRKGGQRTSRWRHWFWNVRLNHYFLAKHHARLNAVKQLPKSPAAMQRTFVWRQWYAIVWRPFYVGLRSRLIQHVKKLTGKQQALRP